VLAPMMMFGCALLSVERPESISDSASGRADQSAGIRQRRAARRAGATVFPHIDTAVVLGALLAIDAGLLFLGLKNSTIKRMS